MTNDATPIVHPPVEGSDGRLQTRAAVLDAAEALFAARGIDGASVRDITKAAGVNLGAINYHFGSKDRLVMEVFARRLEPVNRERLARLDALEKTAAGKPLALSKIIDVFVRPCVESDAIGEANETAFKRLLGRCFMEPHAELQKFIEEQFGELINRFDTAILRAVPGLSQTGLFWRMSFFIGALHHSMMVWLSFADFPHPRKRAAVLRPDREEYIQAITDFVTAGLSAPCRAASSAPAAAAEEPV